MSLHTKRWGMIRILSYCSGLEFTLLRACNGVAICPPLSTIRLVYSGVLAGGVLYVFMFWYVFGVISFIFFFVLFCVPDLLFSENGSWLLWGSKLWEETPRWGSALLQRGETYLGLSSIWISKGGKLLRLLLWGWFDYFVFFIVNPSNI